METPTDNPLDQGVDMSPEAISRRLDMVEALYELGRYLQSAQPVTDDGQNSDRITEEDN